RQPQHWHLERRAATSVVRRHPSRIRGAAKAMGGRAYSCLERARAPPHGPPRHIKLGRHRLGLAGRGAYPRNKTRSVKHFVYTLLGRQKLSQPRVDECDANRVGTRRRRTATPSRLKHAKSSIWHRSAGATLTSGGR